jgi:hypothetical protein
MPDLLHDGAKGLLTGFEHLTPRLPWIPAGRT